MAQFSVYRNPNPVSKGDTPFLLDVQSDLLEPLATTVVVPLQTASESEGRRLGTLTPAFDVAGVRYVMVTPQLAGILRKQVGERVADLTAHRDDILAALDMLITGI